MRWFIGKVSSPWIPIPERMHWCARPAELSQWPIFAVRRQLARRRPCTYSGTCMCARVLSACMCRWRINLHGNSLCYCWFRLAAAESHRGLLLFALRRIKRGFFRSPTAFIICFRHCTRRDERKGTCVFVHRERSVFLSVCPGTWAPRQTRRPRGVCLFLFVAHGEMPFVILLQALCIFEGKIVSKQDWVVCETAPGWKARRNSGFRIQ